MFIYIFADFIAAVSLFTREWIEMHPFLFLWQIQNVSLFTREWIEMQSGCLLFLRGWGSPSLRGSGLK